MKSPHFNFKTLQGPPSVALQGLHRLGSNIFIGILHRVKEVSAQVVIAIGLFQGNFSNVFLTELVSYTVSLVHQLTSLMHQLRDEKR